MSVWDSILGRTPTAEEKAELARDMGAVPSVSAGIHGVAAAPVVVKERDTITDAERAELEALRKTQATVQEQVKTARVQAARSQGQTIARALLASNKILPVQEQAFAAAFGKLAELQAEAEGGSLNVSWQNVTAEGVQPMGCELMDFFKAAIEGSAGHQFTAEQATQDANLKAFFANPTTKNVDKKPGEGGKLDEGIFDTMINAASQTMGSHKVGSQNGSK